MTSLRILMQIAAHKNLLVHQMDVKTAYLNAPIDCDIYLQQPEGYRHGNYVWKLNKSLYGLKQSGRNWNNVIHEFFINQNFIRSNVDPCVYFIKNDLNLTIILIWVDDIILASSSLEDMDKIKSLLNKQFKMKDLGVVNNFLGIHIVQKENEIELDQSTYLHKLLEKFDMKDCKPLYSPCEKNPFAFNNNSSETEQSDQ